jgi:hypothetical protein
MIGEASMARECFGRVHDMHCDRTNRDDFLGMAEISCLNGEALEAWWAG